MFVCQMSQSEIIARDTESVGNQCLSVKCHKAKSSLETQKADTSVDLKIMMKTEKFKVC